MCVGNDRTQSTSRGVAVDISRRASTKSSRGRSRWRCLSDPNIFLGGVSLICWSLRNWAKSKTCFCLSKDKSWIVVRNSSSKYSLTIRFYYRLGDSKCNGAGGDREWARAVGADWYLRTEFWRGWLAGRGHFGVQSGDMGYRRARRHG